VRGVFDDETELAIATTLGMSRHTVYTHSDRLHHKLSVTSRTGLLLYITRQYLALAAASHKPHLHPVAAQKSAASSPARSR
jgi:hypothetical protein